MTAGAVATGPIVDRRADFPVLQREFDGKPVVFLDSAATSQKPVQVIDAMSAYYRTSNSNVHRGVYALAREATDLFEGARERVAAFGGTLAAGPVPGGEFVVEARLPVVGEAR